MVLDEYVVCVMSRQALDVRMLYICMQGFGRSLWPAQRPIQDNDLGIVVVCTLVPFSGCVISTPFLSFNVSGWRQCWSMASCGCGCCSLAAS